MAAGHPSYATLVEVEHGLKKIADRPVQLIWGMRDWCFTPWYLERFIQFFPRAEVQRIENAGHWVMEDAPDRVNFLITQFLQVRAGAVA